MLGPSSNRIIRSVVAVFAASGCGDDVAPQDETSSSGSGDATVGAEDDAGARPDDDSADTTASTPDPTGDGTTEGGSTAAADGTETGGTRTDGGETETGTPDEQPPQVTIVSPRPDRMTPVRQILVEGTVTDEGGTASVLRVDPDGDEAIVVSDDGSFTALVPLTPGANEIEFVASDEAGNETSQTLAVYYGHRVSVGNSQVAYIRDGTLYTWGRNELGQLGNGTLLGSGYGDDPDTADLPVRYEVDVAGLVSVVNRQTFMMAVRGDGHVMTWGSNRDGQLGYEAEGDCGSGGSSPCRRVPTEVPGIDAAIAIAPGFDHAVVLLDDGSVVTFGSNESGQLGYETLEESSSTPTPIADLTEIVQIASGSDASYALTADGDVYAWGENDRGQLGRGEADGDAHPLPVVIPDLDGVVALAAANTTALALRDDGTVAAWGRNHTGQAGVGDDSGDNVLVPTTILVEPSRGMFVPLADVENIAADGFVGLAVTTEGRVYAWGLGALGQLGQGVLKGGDRDLDSRVVASPLSVSSDDDDSFDVVEIEGGAGGPSMSLTRDGDLFGWGWSFRGSLGLDGAINAWAYSTPVLVFPAD